MTEKTFYIVKNYDSKLVAIFYDKDELDDFMEGRFSLSYVEVIL